MIKYKTIPENKTSHGHKWRKGKWYRINGKLELCENGFHCSDNFIDAMGYVTPCFMAVVEVRGEHINDDDKSVHEEMKVLNWVEWTKKDSISLAVFAADLVLENYELQYPDDKRPRNAIEAAKRVLKNNTTKNKSAAKSAAESAESAAWSAAESAARSAIIKKCHQFIIDRKFPK